MRKALGLSLIVSVCVFGALAGCGDSSNNIFSVIAGHGDADVWVLVEHFLAADEDIDDCTECHGGDFSGGISGVACTDCHMGDETEIHPLGWGDAVIGEHGDYVVAAGTDDCANQWCHGTDLDDGEGTSGPSCSTCHPWPFPSGGGGVHPEGWVPEGHKGAAEENLDSCGACHGANFEGGIGPACTACHLVDETTIHPPGYQTHFTGFAPGGLFQTTPPSTCGIAACHAVNFEGVPESGVNCFPCHPNHVDRQGLFENGCLGCHDETDNWSL